MNDPPVGLLAGEGRIPLLAARKLREQGRRVVVCCLERSRDPELESLAEHLRVITPGEFGSVPDYFKDHGVNELLMVGNVDKTSLYDEDARESAEDEVVEIIDRLPIKGDENLIKAGARLLRLQGLSILGVDDVMPEYFTPPGPLAGPPMTEENRRTLDVLESLATLLADQEVGQTVSGKKQSVVAVEGAEGTSAFLRRTGELTGPGSVIMKCARSSQDFRYDVPVVGAETFEVLAEIEASAMALEAERTLWVQRERSRRLAEKHNISFVGWENPHKGFWTWLRGLFSTSTIP